MKPLLDWFDDRTGYRALMHEALYERIPGGARWRYVWGSTLVFAFSVQLITGLFLWMGYSPSGQTAWESVYYIQYEMLGGWLLRGIHHFMAQAMVVLLALHLMQVVIDGAYRAPREVNFWLGLILMQIVLGLSLTGYLLPWDQKGYWATRVATNLMSLVPGVGTDLQQIVVGGADYGHATLTRFFALHAGLLPAALIFFLVLHVAIFRRHGIHVRSTTRAPETTFWPDQVLKDAVACLAVLCVVLLFVFKPAIMGQSITAHPGDMLGADLGAPADPANQYSAARPEWYFLFLFQFLKYFHGESEFYGAIVIPGVLMGVLFLMPIVGRWRLGHWFNVLYVFAVLIGAGLLTAQAWYDDHQANYGWTPFWAEDPKKAHEESEAYLKAVEEAEHAAHRAVELARAPSGIPSAGAASLLHADPFTQGPLLFTRYCATCHDHVDSGGHGIQAEKKSAPNLYNFASRAWIAGLLDPKQVDGPKYFGKTKHREGDMVGFVKESIPESEKDEVRDVVIALSAEAALPAQKNADLDDAQQIATGKKMFEKLTCTDCHKYYNHGEPGNAPDLTGYGSKAWLAAFISNPSHKRFYGEHNDSMPAFAEHNQPQRNVLSPHDLALLVRWLRGDWHVADEKNAE
ncbi:MAG TPA: cytochrome b N-terminal domain-containing protein [Pirellulales bacterium]|jgi:ubiquinol-cytochrome c reductase cytochrome b subunit|nr:cytochrome b N-terminal domain-containing protein [Pirellulales bacterium]